MKLIVALLALACLLPGRARSETAGPAPCPPDSGGLVLPAGFCAAVAADGLGPVRHIAARPNGDLYARLRRPAAGGGIVALRDADGDRALEIRERFFNAGGTGIAVWNDHLYFSTPEAIHRQRLKPDRLVPEGPVETVVSGFPRQGQHAAKSFAVSPKGTLFVNIGAPSNACQRQGRTPGSPGLDPCPQLERHAGIWRFAADRTGQTAADGERFASGIRNAVAIAWNTAAGGLYVVQHGRDQLHQLWPDRYTVEQSAELPAEELFKVDKGDDFGWPYCYYDQRLGKKVLAPEYGGDGRKIGRCAGFEDPLAAFPGHWAPNGLLFYTGDRFPGRYHGGAFIAFHGSWNRAPLPQQGYKVVFVAFADGRPAGEPVDFATGFAGRRPLASPGEARYRPMGLAPGPDGSLYISETEEGRIWRVWYVGEKKDGKAE